MNYAKNFNGDISTWNFDSISDMSGIHRIFTYSAVSEDTLIKIQEKIVNRGQLDQLVS